MARIDSVKKRSRKRQIYAATESLTTIGLEVGIIVFVLTAGYLVYGIFSGGIAGFAKLALADQKRLLSNATLASIAVQLSAALLVASIVTRYYAEDLIGYICVLAGAAGYFLGPNAFYRAIGTGVVGGNPLVGLLLNTLQMVSLILFVPGVALSVRTMLLTMLEGLTGSVKIQDISVVWESEKKEASAERSCVINPKCWDMIYCRPFIKQFCPAWQQKRPCWRIKAGCYCDENTILKALKVKTVSDKWEREMRYGADTQQQDTVTAAAKRNRCRKCAIYTEHQRRKYQVFSPLVFPLVGFIFWHYYNRVTEIIVIVMQTADHFIRLASFTPGATPNIPALTTMSDQTFVILFVIWLAIITLSYILRGLEYCIFKLQL